MVNPLFDTEEGKAEELWNYRENALAACSFKHRSLLAVVRCMDNCARRMVLTAGILEMKRRVGAMLFADASRSTRVCKIEKIMQMMHTIVENAKILDSISEEMSEKQADPLQLEPSVAGLELQLATQQLETEVAKREKAEVQLQLVRKERELMKEKATSLARPKEVKEIKEKCEELEGELEEVDERKFFLEDELRKMSLGGLESTPRISRAPRRKSREMDEAGEVGASRSVSARAAEKQPACSDVDQVASESDTPARMRGPAIDYSDSQRAAFERYGAQAAAGEISTTKAIKNFLADNPALAEREAAVKSQIARARKNAMAAQEAKGKKE